jgi:translation initiation factor 3 subunit G
MDVKSASRWADEIDEDEFTPQDVVEVVKEKKQPIGVPKDNERIVTEIKDDSDTGKKVKIYKTFRLEKQLVSKGVVERKKWTKFGQSKRDPTGPNSYTTVVADEIQMQFLASEKSGMEQVDEIAVPEVRMVRCRFCQDNHFSAKCPYKDSGLPPLNPIASKITDDMLADAKNKDLGKPGKYLPPGARRGATGVGETMMSQRKDDYTIRVSNLPESMSETDMQELCNPFGKIERIFLAKDRATGICKGFAFVTYQSREVASRALKALNGYGYDHLILNVEWSQKRTD